MPEEGQRQGLNIEAVSSEHQQLLGVPSHPSAPQLQELLPPWQLSEARNLPRAVLQISSGSPHSQLFAAALAPSVLQG